MVDCDLLIDAQIHRSGHFMWWLLKVYRPHPCTGGVLEDHSCAT